MKIKTIFFFLFIFICFFYIDATRIIYDIGEKGQSEDELYHFASDHHYKVEPLYPSWKTKYYVLDDQGYNEINHAAKRAKLLNHKTYEEGEYTRIVEANYGTRYGKPSSNVDNNFYFPSDNNAHYIHYSLNTVDPSINGSGVTVIVPDGGVQYDHAAFKRGARGSVCDHNAGFSVCGDDKGVGPQDGDDIHGTMCMSVICADKNTYGGGIASSARCIPRRYICGNRMWTIIDEARANAVDYAAVLSVSNGPPDFMHYYEVPPPALLLGMQESYNHGALRADAIGNGDEVGDNCAFDWTVCQRFMFAISAISASGIKESYSEVCPCASFSGFGAGGSNYIYTAFPDATKKSASNIFDGTSAAAPQYAGIMALALQANPKLDMRTLKRDMIKAASREGIFDQDYPFVENGAGVFHSDAFGFGYVNVTKLIEIVQSPTWAPLPSEKSCFGSVIKVQIKTSKSDADIDTAHIQVDMGSCDIKFVEYVNPRLTFLLDSTRSLTKVSLISPSGTEAVYLRENHYYDLKNLDFYTGAETWYGENSAGIWTFEIGTLDDFELSGASIFIYGY